MGNLITASGTIPRYSYTGREPDETGLVYYRARTYDPTIGRFTQRDPIGLMGGINQYLYVNANPVNFTDPAGLVARDPQTTTIMLAANTYVNTASDASSGMISSGSQNLPASVQADKDSNTGVESPLFGNLDDLIPLATTAKLGAGLLLGTMKVIGTESAEIATKAGLTAYEVGTYKAFQTLSTVGDDLALHHVGQSHAMEQAVLGFIRQEDAAIALPTAEHLAIPTIKGAFEGSARSLLANDINNLRNFTNATNGSLQQLIELNKNLFPGSFVK